MSYDRKPSITLAEFWERESQHGNRYFAGFWGGLSVALLFDGEREHPTRPGEMVKVWRLVAQERQHPSAARRSPSERMKPSRQERSRRGAGARPAGSQRPYSHDGAPLRQDRLEFEPDDPPF